MPKIAHLRRKELERCLAGSESRLTEGLLFWYFDDTMMEWVRSLRMMKVSSGLAIKYGESFKVRVVGGRLTLSLVSV